MTLSAVSPLVRMGLLAEEDCAEIKGRDAQEMGYLLEHKRPERVNVKPGGVSAQEDGGGVDFWSQ